MCVRLWDRGGGDRFIFVQYRCTPCDAGRRRGCRHHSASGAIVLFTVEMARIHSSLGGYMFVLYVWAGVHSVFYRLLQADVNFSTIK